MNGILSVVEVVHGQTPEGDEGTPEPGFYIQLSLAENFPENVMLVGPFDTADQAIALAEACAGDQERLDALFGSLLDENTPRTLH